MGTTAVLSYEKQWHYDTNGISPEKKIKNGASSSAKMEERSMAETATNPTHFYRDWIVGILQY